MHNVLVPLYPARVLKCFLLLTVFAWPSFIAAKPSAQFKLKGAMGERYEKCLEEWFLTAPYANPGMLEMYRMRNSDHMVIVPWYGEFSGKYLTSAALAYTMMPDERLARAIEYVVDKLAEVQDSDGYLGVWPDAQKLSGVTPGDNWKTWDVWSHYHNILGLYFWYKVSGSKKARRIMLRAANSIYDHFYLNNRLLDEAKDGTDAAIGHAFALLYELTKDKRYLDMVEFTFQTFASDGGGDYFNDGLRTVPFYKMKRHRWECLHALETIAGMYAITHDKQYLLSFANIWRSIASGDRHNTGGFSSGESACGNPYDLRAIETCCTIAWMALTTDFVWMGRDSRVADELELSAWNAFLGAQLFNEKVFTYNTPMIGEKIPSTTTIAFQKTDLSPDLNCCSVNAPRGFGMIGQWGARATDEAVTVNYYGESDITLSTPSGKHIAIAQTGNYPFGDRINLKFSVAKRYKGNLLLRIPFWSQNTQVMRDNKKIENVKCGEYLEIEDLRNGDEITIIFDMSAHYWHGDRELKGKSSIYCGPILLTLDQRFDSQGYSSTPTLDLSTLRLSPAKDNTDSQPRPYLLIDASDANGNHLVLCDFASAGYTGTSYTTWFPVAGNQVPVQEMQPWGDRNISKVGK